MTAIEQNTKTLFLMGLAIVLSSVLACRNSVDNSAKPSDTQTESPPELPEITATQFLKNTFLRYRNTSSYHDDGHVRLHVRIDGKLHQEHAPLSVTLNQDRFLLKAYDVRIWSNAKRILSWLDDPTTEHHDGQVRVQNRTADGRPTPEELLADAIISERLEAGLGGIAPQLDWLLADEPMEKLFGQPNSIEYESIKKRDGHWCVTVLVQSESDQYRFWITRRSSLIRCVDLPVPKQIEAGLMTAHPNETVEIESLSLELDQAGFDSPDRSPDASSIQQELPPSPKYVRTLVPLPPPRPTDVIGRNLPDIKARDAVGNTLLTKRGSDRDVTVALLVGDATRKGDPQKYLEPMTMQSVAALADWNRVMPENLRSRIRCLVLSASDVAKQIAPSVANANLPLVMDSNRMLPHREQLVHGDVIVIDRHGEIAWIQKGATTAGLPALGAVVSDVLGGVDVPERLIRQWQNAQAAYEKKLREVKVH